MENFIKKNWALIGFILGFIFDSQFGFLEKLITDPFWLNIVKGIGAILLAYFTKEKLGIKESQNIAGGGIKNPPKP
jgi:hypothetical protein